MRLRCSGTDSAVQKVTKAFLETPGIEGVIGVDGFSLLTQTQSTNSAFFFVAQAMGSA